VVISKKLFKNKNIPFGTLYFLFAGVFLFAAFEEISWGQRILNLQTIEYFSANNQNETNFHNLPLVQPILNKLYFMVGFLGAFLWMMLPKPKTQKYESFKKFFVPKWFLMFYFIPIFLYTGMKSIPSYLQTSPEGVTFFFFGWPDNEIVELLLSAGIFLFLLSNIQRYKKIEIH